VDGVLEDVVEAPLGRIQPSGELAAGGAGAEYLVEARELPLGELSGRPPAQQLGHPGVDEVTA
jgi:hypothetical protein